MKKLLYISLLCLSSLAAAQFSMDRFLAESVTDIELSEVKASLEYIGNNRFRSPWIREMEIRARSNDSELGLEDYRLRFGLLNPGEQRANRQYHNQLTTTTRLRLDTDLNDVLHQRYRLMIENMRLTALDTLLKVEQLRMTIEKEIALAGSDLEKVLETEDDIFRLEMDLLGNQQKLKVNHFLIGERLEFDGTIELDTTMFLSFQSLMDKISWAATNEEDRYQELAEEESKLRSVLYDIEKAESRSNIGFIQAEYDIERGNEFNEHLGYQVGVTLPVFNADRPKLERDKLKLESRNQSSQIERSERERAKSFYKQEVDFMMAKWDLLQKELYQIDDRTSAYNKTEIVLFVQKKRLNLQKQLIDLYLEAMEDYVGVLHLKGVLSSSPLRNYLSKGQHIIDTPPQN